MTVISRAVYDRFISATHEADRIRESLLEPHARKIILALNNERPEKIEFKDDCFCYETEWSSYRLEVALLLDDNWEEMVKKKREERKRVLDQRAAENDRLDKERTEKKDRAELARLLAKYPETAPSDK